jgi:hypothetical protein
MTGNEKDPDMSTTTWRPDCVWCGELLFVSGARLVCSNCAAGFDVDRYRTIV